MKRKYKTFLKKLNHALPWIGFTLFLILAFLILAPTKTVTYEIEVPYTDTEYYIEKEPYQVDENYEVQEPYEATEIYIDTVPIEYDKPIEDCTWKWLFGHCDTKYVKAIKQEEIEKERPVTKYQAVTKSRTVTKYRDVQKEREVMKIKTETKEMEVNWLFEIKMPYRLHLPFISNIENE